MHLTGLYSPGLLENSFWGQIETERDILRLVSIFGKT